MSTSVASNLEATRRPRGGPLGKVATFAAKAHAQTIVGFLTSRLGLVGIGAQAVASLVFERAIGMDPRSLMSEESLSPAAILVGVTRVAIGLITAFALI